jgi:putative flippase GtrA
MNQGLFRQMVRFALVGGANTLTGLAVIYALMYYLKVGPVIANVCGYLVGLVLGFLLNWKWTFSSQESGLRLLPRYLLVLGVAYLLNLAVVLAATNIGRSPSTPYVAQAAGVIIYALCGFLGSRWFVFREAYQGTRC